MSINWTRWSRMKLSSTLNAILPIVDEYSAPRWLTLREDLRAMASMEAAAYRRTEMEVVRHQPRLHMTWEADSAWFYASLDPDAETLVDYLCVIVGTPELCLRSYDHCSALIHARNRLVELVRAMEDWHVPPNTDQLQQGG